MRLVIGTVSETVSKEGDGIFYAKFPDHEDNREIPVLYTSPYYKGNAGGIVAIPEPFSKIIAGINEDPNSGEATAYFIACAPDVEQATSKDKSQEEYQSIRSNDSKASIYGDSDKPVTQTFTNTAGAGVIIQREFSDTKISNNVTLKSETDNEINVGSVGVQIRNNEGDSIVLNGSEPNDEYSARSLAVETLASQEYKCTNSDIKMKVVDGGDINIVNDSTGAFSTDGKWYGNVRLKSRFRNIDLAALGGESYVNIITQGATIQVDSQGTVKIFGQGSIQLESPEDISLNAGGNVNIYGGGGVEIGSGGNVNSAAAGAVQVNGIPNQWLTQSASKDDIAVYAAPVPGSPPAGTQFVPNDYNDPTGAV